MKADMGKLGTAVVLYNEIRPDSPGDILDVRTQADWISEILNELGYEPVKLAFSLECIKDLVRQTEDGLAFVFNLMDSAPREENLVYLVPSILDAMRIPYTGCSPQALFAATDKVLTKALLQRYGLPTPEWITKEDGLLIPNQRYIIKALREDASVGLDNESVVLARSRAALASSISKRETKGRKAFFAERYIDGREFTVCAYGRRDNPIILPPYEWVFPGFEDAGRAKIINYDAKWTENTYEYENLKAVYHFGEEDSGLLRELVCLSETCYRKFDLNGYARIDFRVDDCGRPWILEINANPSFYGFYNIAREHGLEFNEMIKAVIDSIGQEEAKV